MAADRRRPAQRRPRNQITSASDVDFSRQVAPGRLRAVRQWAQDIVVWLDTRGLGMPLRRVLPIPAATLPVLQGAGWVDPKSWGMGVLITLWATCAGLLYVLEHFKEIAALQVLTRKLADINGSFAGGLETLMHHFAGGNHQLGEDESHALCAGLLHRIRDFAAAALGVVDHPRLRATLAVPIFAANAAPGDTPLHLRVWCYDQTHQDRYWTVLEMNWPGAPAAYLSGDVQIINNINEHRDLTGLNKRRFQSVVSIPVASAHDTGQPLAIVSIDADEECFFEIASFLTTVSPFVQPAVKAIGLVLQARRQGTQYAFRR